jgi:preprotein translocase subunit SecG
MVTFLAVVHILACLALVGLVLIQDSKGGGVFTSQATSNSVLGATGATSLAQTMTKVMAVIFALTCIGLSILSARSEKSVVDSALPAAATLPATPAETAPATAPEATPAANENK